MKKVILVILICLIGQLFNCSIFAQGEEIEIGEIVITATKTEKPVKDVPASVSVVKEEEIKNIPSSYNIQDVARNLPSADVRNMGNIATTVPTTLSLRGMGIRGTLVLRDGMVLNDSLNNFVIFNSIPKENISKIEVIRGPFSALYGTNATGGVINIITKDIFEKKLSGAIEFGSYSYRDYSILKQDKIKDLNYSISFERRETENYFADKKSVNRDYKENKFDLRISKIQENSKTKFFLTYLKTEAGYGVTKNIQPERNAEINKEVFQAGISFNSKVKNIKYKINLSANIPKNESISESIDPKKVPPFPPKYVPSINNYSSSDIVLNLEGNCLLDEKNNLTFGSDFSFLKGKWSIKNADTGVSLSDELNKRVENFAIYLQDEIKPGDKTTIIGGLRFDKHQKFGEVFTPKFSINYNLKEETNLYASYGKAFRAPTLGELYSPAWMRVPGKLYIGNPDLKPEKVSSFELGLKHKIKNLDTRVSLYQNKAKNLIQLQTVGNFEINQNIGKAKTEGIELETLYKANKNINLGLNYSYLEAKDKATNETLEYSPYNKLNFKILGNFEKVGFNTYFNFVDERFYIDRKTGNKFKLKSYLVTDLNLIYNLDKSTSLNFSVRNLFNETYEEYGGYPGQKRSLSFGIKRAF